MSKMNEMSIDAQEAAFEQMVEEERNQLRQEGAEELRFEIRRVLRTHMEYEPDGLYLKGMAKALTIVENVEL
jgi:hypothetical protein